MNLRAFPEMIAMIPSVVHGVGAQDLERIKIIARKAYPDVPQLSTEALSEWMHGEGAASLLLVDVRSPVEFAVSHLHRAINLQTADQIAREATNRNPARTILYCSVGFRSSRLAHMLAQRDIQNVLNLEGSIFQWANEGKAIYQGEIPAKQVHPYGRRWMGLLKPGLATEC